MRTLRHFLFFLCLVLPIQNLIHKHHNLPGPFVFSHLPKLPTTNSIDNNVNVCEVKDISRYMHICDAHYVTLCVHWYAPSFPDHFISSSPVQMSRDLNLHIMLIINQCSFYCFQEN